MRHLGLAMLWLALTAAVSARAADEKPILVLDAGGHTAAIRKVLFTPDGKELITVSDDKTIRTWDVKSGSPLRVLRPPIGPGSDGMLYAAAVSPDGRTLAVGGYPVGAGAQGYPFFLVDLAAGRIVRTLTGHTALVDVLAFSPDGTRLASGSVDHTVQIWDPRTGRCERVLQGHADSIYGVAFSPDGLRLATASNDHTGRIWSLVTGQAEAVLRGHTREVYCIAWRPDGKVVATGSFDRSIRLWGPDGGAFQGYPNLGGLISSVVFTADSRRLLFTRGYAMNNRCSLIDLATGKERVKFDGHTNTVMDGALSPDGTLAATAGGDNDEVYLWRTADAAVIHRLAAKGRSNYAVAWSSDGSSIAWGNINRGPADNATINPLERAFRTGELEPAAAPDTSFRRAQLARGPLALHSRGETTVEIKRGQATVSTLKLADPYETIRCFTFLPGDHAAIGTEYGLYLYDTRTWTRLREFRGHTGAVLAVAPSPDGRTLLSASVDQTLRIWDPGSCALLVSYFFAGDEWVAWTPEGYYAASPAGEKLMGWHVGHGRDALADFFPAAQLRKSLYRPDVVKLIPANGSTERALEIADHAKGKTTERVEVAEVLPPNVAISSPDVPGTRVHEKNLEVKAIATSVGMHPVTGLRLLLDGRPYRGQGGVREVASPKLGEARASWSIALDPGPHSLAVQADSAVSRGVSKAVDVVAVGETPVVLPALYVLAVGVSAYPGGLRLNYAASDAEAVASAFRERSKDLFRQVDVRLLTDQKATRAEVLKGLAWLRKQMTQRDVGVILFSGHGQKDADGLLYLLPVDVDPEELLATAVPGNQLKETLAGIPGRVITLLDACHAGAAGGDHRKGTGGLTDDLVRDLVTDDYGVVTMASSMGSEESLESVALRQGYFTRALVEGLSGAADFSKDGVVYLSELDTYVTDRVKALSKGQQHPVTAKPTSIRSFPLAKP